MLTASALSGLLWSATNVKTLIPATLGMAFFAFLMARFLKGRSERVRNLPFVVLAVTLLLLEVVKQVRAIREGYGPYNLPFHFSSVYLFVYPLAHFTRGKFATTMKSAAAAMSAMTAQGIWFFPMTVFGDSAASYFTNFGSFHTITYHYAVILYLFLFIALSGIRPNWRRDGRILVIAITIFTLYAAPLANLFQANFTSFLFSALPPLEAIRVALTARIGTVPTQILYDLFMYVMILVTGRFALGLWIVLDRSAFGIRIRTHIQNAPLFRLRPIATNDLLLSTVNGIAPSGDDLGRMRAVQRERQLI